MQMKRSEMQSGESAGYALPGPFVMFSWSNKYHQFVASKNKCSFCACGAGGVVYQIIPATHIFLAPKNLLSQTTDRLTDIHAKRV